MRRSVITLFLVILLSGVWGSPPAEAGRRSGYTPVKKFMASESLLNIYYADYVERYGKSYKNKGLAFKSFCRLLRTSDMLADEMRQLGLPAEEVYGFLAKLEEANLKSMSRANVRRAMLTIDYVLESIESAQSRKYRSEFRREVLAQTPPVTHTG